MRNIRNHTEEINNLRGNGWTLQRIADKYGCSNEYIRQILLMNENAPRRLSFEKRFLSGFTQKGIDDCWTWEKTRVEKGYGRIYKDGRSLRVHRVSWEYYNNKKIPAGKFVLHTCDVPYCVNPKHLYIGTNSDNMRDRSVRGRNTSAKLTQHEATKIRSMYKSMDLSQRELSALFGISEEGIRKIINNITYIYAEQA